MIISGPLTAQVSRHQMFQPQPQSRSRSQLQMLRSSPAKKMIPIPENQPSTPSTSLRSWQTSRSRGRSSTRTQIFVQNTLTTMPCEVQFMVFEYLDFLDLIHLSQSCTSLRYWLTSQHSETLYQHAVFKMDPFIIPKISSTNYENPWRDTGIQYCKMFHTLYTPSRKLTYLDLTHINNVKSPLKNNNLTSIARRRSSSSASSLSISNLSPTNNNYNSINISRSGTITYNNRKQQQQQICSNKLLEPIMALGDYTSLEISNRSKKQSVYIGSRLSTNFLYMNYLNDESLTVPNYLYNNTTNINDYELFEITAGSGSIKLIVSHITEPSKENHLIDINDDNSLSVSLNTVSSNSNSNLNPNPRIITYYNLHEIHSPIDDTFFWKLHNLPKIMKIGFREPTILINENILYITTLDKNDSLNLEAYNKFSKLLFKVSISNNLVHNNETEEDNDDDNDNDNDNLFITQILTNHYFIFLLVWKSNIPSIVILLKENGKFITEWNLYKISTTTSNYQGDYNAKLAVTDTHIFIVRDSKFEFIEIKNIITYNAKNLTIDNDNDKNNETTDLNYGSASEALKIINYLNKQRESGGFVRKLSWSSMVTNFLSPRPILEKKKERKTVVGGLFKKWGDRRTKSINRQKRITKQHHSHSSSENQVIINHSSIFVEVSQCQRYIAYANNISDLLIIDLLGGRSKWYNIKKDEFIGEVNWVVFKDLSVHIYNEEVIETLM